MDPPSKLPTRLTVQRGAWERARREELQIEGFLGEGASARVVAVRDPAGRRRALKWARPGFDERLLEEARVLRLLAGSGVPLFDELVWIEEAEELRVGFLFELLEGEPLTRLDGELAERVLRALSATLHEIHRAGFCHGDVKPDNVLFMRDGRVVLFDFGLAGSMGERVLDAGTPRYLPPEWRRGERTTGAAADTYALGLLLVELLFPEARAAADLAEWAKRPLPAPWEARLRPLLEERPGHRASLGAFTEEGEPPAERAARERRAIFQAYGVVREVELAELAARAGQRPEVSFSGPSAPWVEAALEFLGVRSQKPAVRLEAPRPASPRPGRERAVVQELRSSERARFLARLLGPMAWDFGFGAPSEAELIGQLWEFAGEHPLSSWTGSTTVEPNPVELTQDDPAGWALLLARKPVPPAWVEELEKRSEGLPRLRLELARIHRRRGELGRAARLLAANDDVASRLELAIVEQRRGDRDAARALLARSAQEGTPEERAAACALEARRAFDSGEFEAARALLEGLEPWPAVCEVRALVELGRGALAEARDAVARGLACPVDDERLARLEGVRGMIEHAQGEPLEAERAFRRAAEGARRAGAWLEEATYLTGVAAAASDAGRLEECLNAAERAAALFESLGKKREEAHALLARASVLAALEMEAELRQVVERARARALDAGDKRCAGYLELCLVDGLSNLEARQAAAARAREWLESGSEADRVRSDARLWELGLARPEGGDERARRVEEREARLDWWKARAIRALPEPSDAEVELILGELRALGGETKDSLSSGPALVRGAELALAAGRVRDARELLALAEPLAARLVEGLGDEARLRALELPWVRKARTATPAEDAGEQLRDVEGLLRALKQREGLGALVRQVLDLLLLWTGVERGLLLLRAPGGKLVVRGARNLRRVDLGPEQLALSRSLAERALAEGRPIVAVDARGDLSESHKSVHALRLRSVLALPLIARGEVLGVAYLDDRVRRGAFGPQELAWAGLIGTVAALGIADERDRLALRRAARRAERAEARLAAQLGKRQVELELAARELSEVRGGQKLRGTYAGIVGRSKAMRDLITLVDRVAESEVPVLVIGESGTGKELIARALAEGGPRKDKPFVAENCASVPESLLESTLFGHVRGAFTGASQNRAGLFEVADGGTLFLDEIGEMSLSMQSKLLRALQQGEIRPVGASRSRRVNVRVLAATHRDLAALVKSGAFREDLFYRLNVVSLRVPPLRERPDDVPPLVEHFLRLHGGGKKRSVSASALERLRGFSWPGNVRQLENEVRRMLVLGGQEITVADLSPEIAGAALVGPAGTTLRDQVDSLERRLVLEALEETRGNRTRAAEALGLSRFGLQKMMARLGIPDPQKKPESLRIAGSGVDEAR